MWRAVYGASHGLASSVILCDQLIDELVGRPGRAMAEGLQLTDEGGLLQQLTVML